MHCEWKGKPIYNLYLPNCKCHTAIPSNFKPRYLDDRYIHNVRKKNTCSTKLTNVNMALPIIEKNWEKPQMSIKEELVESWHIHTMDFYIDIKKKEAKL